MTPDTKQGGVSIGEEGGGGFQFVLALKSNPCPSVHTSHRSLENGLDDYRWNQINSFFLARLVLNNRKQAKEGPLTK